MDTHNPGSLSLLLIGCALSASVSVPVLAAGDGVIVIERQVQPYAIGRPRGQDPYPNTVNANPSAQVNRAMNHELSDNDIAGISRRLSEPGLCVSMAVFLILHADPKQRCQEQSRTRAAFYLLLI